MEIAPPGGKQVTVKCVMGDEFEDSKRIASIDRQDTDLQHNMKYLDEGTRAKNREFDIQINYLHEMIDQINKKLEVASREREQASIKLEKHMKINFEELIEEHLKNVDVEFDKVNERIPPIVNHIADVENDSKHYVNVIVPDVIEKQSGQVMKKLKAAHESFDIEVAKIHTREEKIKQRFADHKANTAQTFCDETNTRKAKLALMVEDIRVHEDEFNRGEEGVHLDMNKELKKTQEQIMIEESRREEEDCVVLDSMLDAQKELQRIVLQNFGVNTADKLQLGGGGTEPPVENESSNVQTLF